MHYLPVVSTQVLIMALYIAVGFLLRKGKLISEAGSKSMANLLLYAVLPCVIINSFRVERSAEHVRTLLISAGLGLLLLLLSMAISALLLRKDPIANFASSFPNAGFMGLPLVTAVLGGEAVFYVVGYVALLNVLQWTYGQWIMGSRREIQGRALLKNPIVLSLLLGVALFFIQLPLPSVLSSAINGIAALNAPLAMIILGIYLAQADPQKMFCCARFYWVGFIRLILIPAASLLILLPLPDACRPVVIALLLSASTPAGSTTAVYAQKIGLDYAYAGQLVCVSTLLSLLTLPLLAGAIGALL